MERMTPGPVPIDHAATAATAQRAQTVAFGVLGPVEIRLEGSPVDLGGPKQRAVLAMLVMNADRPVSLERLIDELWDDPPATAQKVVQVYVTRLRRILSGLSDRLETTPAGYVLHTLPGEVDLHRFETLSAEGRSALTGDPATASARFQEALALCRGAPLADIASEPLGRLVVPRLDEQLIRVLEDRIESDLSLGRHAELVAELNDLVVRHPFRERLWAQLMLALYRSGRQAEALETYRRADAQLREELGIEPGPELQRLHASVLRQDPDLDAPGRSPAPQGEGPERSRSVRRRARPAAFAVAALLTVAALVLGVKLRVGPSERAVAVQPNSIAVLDPASDAVVADIPVGSRPGPIAVDGASAWVGNLGDRTVERLAVRTRSAVKTIGLPAEPVSLSAGNGVLWIGNGFDGTLSRILTAYDQLSAPFFPGPSVQGLLAVTATPSDLWVGLSSDAILRLDPASLREKSKFEDPGRPKAIAVGAGSLWTIQFFDDDVRRIDPDSGEIESTVPLPYPPQVLAVGDGSVWVATSGDDRLWRIDEKTDRLTGSLPLGIAASAILTQPGTVWVLSGRLLERIDPNTSTLIRTVRLGRPAESMALVGGQVWLTVD